MNMYMNMYAYVLSQSCTQRRRRSYWKKNYDCQNIQQVCTGVPTHIKQVFTEVPTSVNDVLVE